MSKEEGKSEKILNGSVESPIMKTVIGEKALVSPVMVVVPVPQNVDQTAGQTDATDTAGGSENQGNASSGKDK